MLDDLHDALKGLKKALADKGVEFSDDAEDGSNAAAGCGSDDPRMEFTSWAVSVEEDIVRLKGIQTLLTEINMGGTAIGTGIQRAEGYAQVVSPIWQRWPSFPASGERPCAGHSRFGTFVMSGTARRIAVKVSKISNDLRLLSSGPRTGISEITLPPMQPGSSIMPGKVNPVIPK